MTVTAPGPVAAAAALAKLSLPLPQSAAAPHAAARAPDHVDLAPPPTEGALWELAFTGAQHLDILLSTLERMLGPGLEPMPFALGHLTRAVGDAAHQIDAGSADLAAHNDPIRPSHEALEGWRQTARTALHQASDLLTRAENRLIPLAADKNPDTLWALTQVVAAQREVGTTVGNLRVVRRSRPPISQPSPRSSFHLSDAAAILGLFILLLILAVAYGMWLTVAGLIALGIALTWLWRVVLAARKLRIEIQR